MKVITKKKRTEIQAFYFKKTIYLRCFEDGRYRVTMPSFIELESEYK